MEPAYKYETASTVKAEEQLNFKPSEKFNFIAGGNYETYSAVPYSADLAEPVNTNEHIHGTFPGTKNYYSPDGLAAQFYFLKYWNAGTYLQVQYSPVQKINFTLGTRYDINSRYGNAFNPRAGIVYTPYDKTTLKLLYGSAFLAPSPSTSYGYWGAFDTPDSGRTFHSYFLHLPNPGLKPVTSQNTELSIRQYLSDNFSITVDGYYTSLKNLAIYADDNNSAQLYHNMFNGIPVDYIEVPINQARQTNYGGSIQLNWKRSMGRLHINSFASLSYVNGKVENAPTEGDESAPDAELEFISPFRFKAGADIKIGKFSCSPRLVVLSKQNLTGISDSTATPMKRQTIAGYTLLNLSLRYNLTKKLSAFANITNLLNQGYRSVGINMSLKDQNTELFPGQPGEPLRITGGINFSF
jgi:iron complex outermembrane receptor protein